METLAAPKTEATARGWETVDVFRRLLASLGADDDLLHRVVLRTDLDDRQYVNVPPLPTDLVARLVPGPAVR